MRKRLVVAAVVLVFIGAGVGWYWIWRSMDGHHVASDLGDGANRSATTSTQAPPPELELPMYELIDQPELKVPVVNLGETLQVGPVRVTVALADGFCWPDENAEKMMMALYGLRVEIENQGDGILDLNPKTAYWIAEEKQLRTTTFDPRINWFVLAPGDRRRISIPDPKFLHEELGLRGTEVYSAFWARDKKKWTPLPASVGPGEKAEGWIYFDMVDVPGHDTAFDEPYYLFFGSWPAGKAWGGFRFPAYESLYAMVRDVGSTSRVVWEMPWGSPDMIMDKPDWLEPVETPPPDGLVPAEQNK